MIFQLSSIKAAWTDKLTKQFTPPHPGQDSSNAAYQLYLQRDRQEEDLSLLQWLRSHTIVANKSKTLTQDKYLVAVKFVSMYNPVFFQHLLVHHPHCDPCHLSHVEESSMPSAIQYFSQAVTLHPQNWTTADQILEQFQHKGHLSSFLTKLVAYMMAPHDILYLWRQRVVDRRIGCLQTRSIERLYPLSPFQMAIYRDIVDSLAQRQRFLDQAAGDVGSSSSSGWSKYCLLLGKPGTGKSQVVIRAIHHALQQEAAALLAAPVALLAQGYRAIFRSELECETLHAAFHVLVDPNQSMDVNFSLNRFDMVVVGRGLSRVSRVL